MGYGLGGRGSIPGKGKIFLFFIASRPALGRTQAPILRVPGAISPAVKRPGREAGHSHASSAYHLINRRYTIRDNYSVIK
jgi:hypothetical protein